MGSDAEGKGHDEDSDVFEDSQEDWESLLEKDKLKPVAVPAVEPPKVEPVAPSPQTGTQSGASTPGTGATGATPGTGATGKEEDKDRAKPAPLRSAVKDASKDHRSEVRAEEKLRETDIPIKKNEVVVGSGIVIQVNNTERPKIPPRKDSSQVDAQGFMTAPPPERILEARMAAYHAIKNFFGRELNVFEQNALSAALDAYRNNLFGAPPTPLIPGGGHHGGGSLLQNPHQGGYSGGGPQQGGYNGGGGGGRPSQSSGGGGGGGYYSNANQQPVPIHRGENAWVPGTGKTPLPDIEAVKRKMISILNKLTLDNFEQLMEKVKEVGIQKEEHLEAAIRIVFDKALGEPHFSSIYADLCSRLSHLDIEPQDASKTGGRKITFRRLLLNRCQTEFEAEGNSNEVQNCEDPAEKKAIALRLRKRHLGLVIFIGELFKQKMLHENILHECIENLLGTDQQRGDDESLECLCKLLHTMGSLMDKPEWKKEMASYFQRIEMLSNDESVISRVRFGLRDVLELRQNHWKPRRVIEGPKKVEEVRAQARKEMMARGERPVPVVALVPPIGGFPKHGGVMGMHPNHNQQQMQMQQQMHMQQQQQQASMMGPFSGGGGGQRGSMGGQGAMIPGPMLFPPGPPAGALGPHANQEIIRKMQQQQQQQQQQHQFVAPGGIMSPPSNSQKHAVLPAGDVRHERKSSNPGAAPPAGAFAKVTPPSSGASTPAVVEEPAMTEEKMAEKCDGLVQEYCSSRELPDAVENVGALATSERNAGWVVQNVLMSALDIKGGDREAIRDHLLPAVITQGPDGSAPLISVKAFEHGLQAVLAQLEDLILDVGPNSAKFLAEIVAKVFVSNKKVPPVLNTVLAALGPAIAPFVFALFQMIHKRDGEDTAVAVFGLSGVPVETLFEEGRRDAATMAAVLESKELLFLAPFTRLGPALDAAIKEGQTAAQVVTLTHSIVPAARRTSSRLSRVLVRSVLAHMSAKTSGDAAGRVQAAAEKEVMDRYRDAMVKLLSTPRMQMEILFEVHRFCMEMNWPEGLMERVFSWLYNSDVVPEDCFLLWKEDSSEVVPQKGKALFQVNRWMNWLETAPEDSDAD